MQTILVWVSPEHRRADACVAVLRHLVRIVSSVIARMKPFDLPPAALASASRLDGAATVAGDVAPIALSSLGIDEFATIHSVLPASSDVDRDLVMRLIEIGFVPGERVRIIAVGRLGREPIAVRLVAGDGGRSSTSGATFAMRRHEADFIHVVPDRPEGAAGRAPVRPFR
jgi:ferrous iron transport protein A